MAIAGTLKLLYLTHDLSDPATHKRVLMLVDGGADVTVAGFRRCAEPVLGVAGCPAIDFGQTHNGGFGQRLWSVWHVVMRIKQHRTAFASAHVIVARNLEMLAIGVRGRSLCSPSPILIYECLDIHRLLLKNNAMGRVLRWLEGWLAKRTSALITSSPAFISEYFNKRSCVRLPVRLVENKVYSPNPPAQAVNSMQRPPGIPWRIGWFGAIRCRKSLEILTQLVRQGNGTVEVIIRGRPSLDQFDDFHRSTAALPGLQFHGSYKNPEELASIYQDVHFAWAIDLFEEGLNSSWLLPNRIYEGSLYGAVPMALAGVETGRFLKRLGIGVILDEPNAIALADFFSQLTVGHYGALKEAVMAVPKATWMVNKRDCQELVAYIGALTNAADR